MLDTKHILIDDESYEKIMTWWNEYKHDDGILLWYLVLIKASLMPAMYAKVKPAYSIIIGDAENISPADWGTILLNSATSLNVISADSADIAISLIADTISNNHLAFFNENPDNLIEVKEAVAV